MKGTKNRIIPSHRNESNFSNRVSAETMVSKTESIISHCHPPLLEAISIPKIIVVEFSMCRDFIDCLCIIVRSARLSVQGTKTNF